MTTQGTGGGRRKPGDDLPDEETGQFGDAEDPGIEADEDLDGERDADGGEPLHHHPDAPDETDPADAD